MSILTQHLTDEQIAVRAGCAYLDEHRTDHWRQKIDLDRLDIEDPCNCVLGQLYGNFYDAVAKLGFDYSNVDRLGFDNDPDGTLTAAWKEQLRDAA